MKTKTFLVLIFSFLAFSCVSTSFELDKNASTVLVSVTANTDVNWYEEPDDANDKSNDSGAITGLLNKSIDRNNPEYHTAKDRANATADSVTRAFTERGFTILTPATNPELPCYKKNPASLSGALRTALAADGYQIIKNNSKPLDQMTAKKSGADNLLYVEVKFYKQKEKIGFQEIGAAPKMILSAFIADKNGKVVFSREQTYDCPRYADMRNSVYDKDELCELFPQFIDESINTFFNSYFLY